MVAGGQAEDEDNYVDKPRVPTVLPRVALVHGQCRVVDEPGEDGNRTQPPRGAAVLRDEPPQQEPEYLYFGSEGEGGEPIYDDFDLPAPVHEEPIYDDIDLPAPVHEEPIYDDIDLPAPVHEEPIYDDFDLT
ncbi:uncharacterized protein LOC126983669 isoform X2 [Eriocheir sinensis]|nr:uncharacterized protein LOC126983669 isoform X2 [Eriocheir sinensis]